MGKRSSIGWIPVAFGLYSLKRIATSTPSPATYSSKREGTRVPSSSYRSERGTSFPKRSTHSIQEDFSVGSRAACTCASMTGTPLSITSLLWRLQHCNKPSTYVPRYSRSEPRTVISLDDLDFAFLRVGRLGSLLSWSCPLPSIFYLLHVPDPKRLVLAC